MLEEFVLHRLPAQHHVHRIESARWTENESTRLALEEVVACKHLLLHWRRCFLFEHLCSNDRAS